MRQEAHSFQAGSLMLAVVALAGSGAAQQFVRNTTDIPSSTGFTENVDFADIDLDGDWDALFANGGDAGNQQDVLWTNNGGSQGGTVGVFTNVTPTQLPAVLDTSRDVEFVDFDNDGDVDAFISNTAQIINQSNRWWRNTGPGAGIGFYVDETAARWSGLGGPGSSIAPGFVLGSGGFIDWSCDSDFGDLDNDGDLDLVHSSYGGAFGGKVPTRVFLNDGAGVFSEFNPSGFQLPGANIANGNPGLWCQGIQAADTTDATGTNCDIASSAIDIDLGDIDGDFDLDLLHGARQERPRMFQNRLEENGGSLGFRDVTSLVFPPGYASGTGHYAQEFGDLDNDADWDILAINWVNPGIGFHDSVMKNNGAGIYGAPVLLPDSGSDDNEGDFIDYDNDGDVDVIIANFSGQDRLYQNDGTGAYTAVPSGLPVDTTTTLDADMADVDNDGDSDLFAANDANQAEWYLQNTTFANDTFAPIVAHLEQALDRQVGPDPTVIRVHVYSNASYYTTWYHSTVLEYTVDAGPVQTVPMQSSQGQVFRGEIPGGLVGTIAYHVESTDEHGNTGASATNSYIAGPPPGTSFCWGDGSLATPCPCVPPNTVPSPSGAPGHGCANTFDQGGAMLSAAGTLSPDTIHFTVQVGGNYAAFALMLKGTASNPSGAANADGVLCVSGALTRFGAHNAATGGAPLGAWTLPNTNQTNSISVASAQAPGQTAYYQLFYRNAQPSFCTSATANWSNGYSLAWPP